MRPGTQPTDQPHLTEPEEITAIMISEFDRVTSLLRSQPMRLHAFWNAWDRIAEDTENRLDYLDTIQCDICHGTLQTPAHAPCPRCICPHCGCVRPSAFCTCDPKDQQQ